MKKLSYKNYNKRIITRDNGNVQSHDLLHKAKLDSEFLMRCRDSNVIHNFLYFRVSGHSLKASLTCRQCQLKLLQKEIRHKKSDIRVLKK